MPPMLVGGKQPSLSRNFLFYRAANIRLGQAWWRFGFYATCTLHPLENEAGDASVSFDEIILAAN